MPRMKKPVDQKLSESINTPVTRELKRRAVALARAKGNLLTRVTREYIERGVAHDEKASTAGK
jgi:hypothetical protein